MEDSPSDRRLQQRERRVHLVVMGIDLILVVAHVMIFILDIVAGGHLAVALVA